MLKFQYYKLLRSPEGAKESIVRFCNWFWFRNVGYIYGIARICNILSNRQVSKGIFSCCGYWQYYWKISFLPVVLFPLAYALGKMIYPFHVQKYIMNHLRYQTCFQVTFYDIKELITE